MQSWFQLYFIQSSISHDVLCIEVKSAGRQHTALTYSFPNLEPVCCFMSSSNCCFLICTQDFYEAGKVVWYSHLLKKFPQRLHSPISLMGFPCGSAGKESACNGIDLGPISGSGRSPGEGKGHPLQYSGLENSMDCSPWSYKELNMTEWLSLSLSPL